MVSSEVAPIAKTGGLADVVGSLPSALRALGDEAAVFVPRYGTIDLKGLRRVYDTLPIHLGAERYDCLIYEAPAEFPLYLLECPPLFERKGFYGESGLDYPDNHTRFAVFARAALEVARRLFRTDVFHCHDWQAGLVPAYLRSTFATDPTFFGARTLFTIHNLGYQGLFPKTVLPEIALDPALFRAGEIDFFGSVSYLKAGIALADGLSTVSPTYAREIQTPEYGFGLEGILQARAGALSGILNGVNYAEWNPETDPLIPANYSAGDLAGKRVCKERLLAECGLPPEAMARPLLGIVSRLTSQKGADLLAEASQWIPAEDVYLVVLGEGDPAYEDFFRDLAEALPGRVAVRIGYDNALAHRILAGVDMFLMPSRYEPCGMTQMFGLKYGAVPVVRSTGGLDDTIEEGTGFKFAEYSGAALLEAVRDAVRVFSDAAAWRGAMLRGMAADFSWEAAAKSYSALYGRLLAGVNP
jgi:starch synthase